MKKTFLFFILISSQVFCQQPILTSVVDGDCIGARPRFVEIFAQGTIDFSNYRLEKQINGGAWDNSTDLSTLGTITDEFVYILIGNTDQTILNSEFPSITTQNIITDATLTQNGDDGIRIVEISTNVVIDQFGETSIDGTGQFWEYTDSYAKRVNYSIPDGGFVAENWFFAGVDAFEGYGTCQGGSETFEEIMGGIATYTFLNNPPTTQDISLNIPKNTESQITLSGTDDYTENLAYQIVQQPVNGMVNISGNIAVYTPNTDYEGPDSFTYKANDGTSESNESTVTLNIFEAPNLTLSLDVTQLSEGETAQLTATLDEVSAFDVVIDLTNTSGAANEDDYTITFGGELVSSITIPAGNTQGQAQINVLDDGIVETKELLLFLPSVNGANYQEEYAIKLYIEGNAALLNTLVHAECQGNPGGASSLIEIYVDGTFDFTDYSLDFGLNDNFQENTLDLSSFGSMSNAYVYIIINSSDAPDTFIDEFSSVNPSNSLTTSANYVFRDFSYRIQNTVSDATLDQISPHDGYGIYMERSYARRINNTGPDFGFVEDNWDIQEAEFFNWNSGLCNGGSESLEELMGGLGLYSNTNSAPITSDINKYTLINEPIQFELLGDDFNPENLTYSLETFPSHGQATIIGNMLTYTPDTDFEGEDVFTYKTFDGEFESNISTITIGVTHIPDISFSIDTNEIAEHQAATITATLDAPGPYDVNIDLSNFSGTANQYDFTYLSSNVGGIRFIKFEAYYSSDNGQVNLGEIKAFTADGTNVACGKSGYANSYQWGDWSSNGSNVTDCQDGGRWSSDRNDPGPSEAEPHYIVVDLEDVYELDSIEIVGDNWDMSFSVLVSADEENWGNLGTYTNYFMGTVNFDEPNQNVGGANEFVIKSGETTATIKVQGIEDNITEGTENLTIATPIVENANLQNPQDFTIDILDVVTSFTLIEDMFAGFSNAEFAWGDYDLDGDMDVAIMGDQGNGLETLLYRNEEVDGERIFVDSQQNFESLGFGTLKWVDIDKDGLLDLFVSGIGQSGANSLLYRNTTDIANGIDFVLDSSYNFPSLFQTSVDFGDLDNDGDVDYAINGTNSSGQQVSYYGFQDETGQFEIINSNFGTFDDGAIKIFDVNADGDNEVVSSAQAQIITYFSNNTNPLYPTHDFEELEYFNRAGTNTLSYLTIGNNGNPSTVSNISNINIPGYVNGDFTIADYNNDGYEDIFVSGSNVAGDNPAIDEISSVLYQGNQGIYEASSEFTFQPMTDASVEWIDYDNDGDLDLILSGFVPGLGQKTYLYEVEVTNKKNTPPSKIIVLNYEDLENGNIQLSWEAPEDDFNAIMGYNLRLGTTPGGDELSYLLSEQQTGQLLVNQPPSILNTNFTIQLDPGVYYWSVQAVDKGYKGGEFSDEQNFTLTYDWKILNQGGIIDKSIQAVNNPMLEFMDLDNDGDYDLLYGQSGSQLKVYSFENNLLSVNQSYSLNSSIEDIEIGDLNLDGSFDIVGKQNTNQNIIYLSDIDGTNVSFNSNNFSTSTLYGRKQRLADLNNDGNLDITNFGLNNQNEFLANFKMYSSYFDLENNSYVTNDLSDNFTGISQMFSPSFDIGDFDNDQDLDVVISGDLIFGNNITKIYENTTEAGSQNISFQEYAEANLPGVKDGSTTFIDFDSDGDLDLLLSGFDNVGNRVFAMYENVEQGAWPEVETNLPEMTDTEIEFGDFNGDGLSDLLISGITLDETEVTQLMEYEEGIGFVASDYDLSEFSNAKFAFGDLDGDNDLDFVIAGQSASNSQPLIRVYLNYRADSYAVLNANDTGRNTSSNLFNEAPSQPSILNINLVDENSEGRAIINISWSQSSDDNTPSNAISYALKIGTSPGSEDVISSGALPNGYRKISGNGNTEFNNSWNIVLEPGDYYTSVQSVDASFVGSEFSNELMFTVNPDNKLSIDDIIEDLFGVYPNPTKSIINISMSNDHKIKDLKLFDILGKSYAFRTDGKTFLDMSRLSNGLYILELTLENGNKITKKIIKN